MPDLQPIIDELNRRRVAALTRVTQAIVEGESARHAGVAEGLLVALKLLAGVARG